MRFPFRFLMSALIACTLSSAAFSQIMEEEPNDELFQAQLVPLNQTVIATWGSNFEWDFFRYEVTQYGKLTFDVVNAALPPLSLVIAVDSESPTQNLGQSIETINPGSAQMHIEKCCLAPGTYYVRLRAPNNTDNDEYHLECIFTPYDGPQDEAQHQTNDTSFDADPITLDEEFQLAGITGQDTYYNDLMRDRRDWFEFDLGARGDIVIDSLEFEGEFDATCASWDVSAPGYRMYLDQGNLGQGAGQVSSEFEARCVAPGAHYIRVLDPSFDGIDEYCRSYVFYGHLELQEGGDDGELDNEDDSFEDAREIDLGDDTAELIGHLGYKFFEGIPVADSEDWWKVTTPSNGTFSAGIEWDPELINPAIDFFAPDGTGLPFSSTSQTGEGFKLKELACLEAGLDILIRIKNFGGTCGQYTLYFPDPTGDGIPTSDDNDTVETADEIDLTSSVPVSIGMRGYDEEYDDVTDAKDYFRFTLEDGGFSVFFQDASELPGYQLYLSDLFSDDDDLTEELPGIAASSVFEEETFVTYDCLGAGEYILEITPGATLGCDEFTLSLSQSSTAAADAEPEPEEGVLMEGNSQEGSLGHDVDFVFGETGNFLTPDYSDTWRYAFDAPGEFFVDVTSGFNNLDFEMSVKSSSGLELTQYGEVVIDNTSHWRWEVNCLGADTLTITVGLGPDGDCGAYTLEVGDTGISVGDEEPNDSYETATQISTGTMITGHLGHLDPADFETIDWKDFFQFDWSVGNIEVSVSNEEGVHPEFDLFVQSGDLYLPVIATETGEDGQSSFKHYDCRGEGTYFLQLNAEGVNGYDCRSYALTVNGESEESFNDDESNEPKQAVVGETKNGSVGHVNAQGVQDNVDTYAYALEEGGTLRVVLDADIDMSPFSILGSVNVRPDFLGSAYFPTTYEQEGSTLTMDFNCYGEDSVYVNVYTLSDACTKYSMTTSIESPVEYDKDNEPNNASLEGELITPDDSPEGWLMMENVSSSIDPELEIADTQDWYTMEFEHPMTDFAITANRDLFNGGLENGELSILLLYEDEEEGSDLITAKTIGNVGDAYVAEYCCLAAGTYYIGVFSENGSCGSYRLTFDAAEAENDTHTSTLLAPESLSLDETVLDGLGFSYDNEINTLDFFQFQIPFSKSFTIDLDTEGSSIYATVAYKGADSAPSDNPEAVLSFYTSLTEGPLVYNCPRPGYYVLTLSGGELGECLSYSLNVSQENAEQDNFEINDTASDAAEVGTLSTIEGNVGYASSAFDQDLRDYFTFTSSAGTQEELTFSALTQPDGEVAILYVEVFNNESYTQLPYMAEEHTYTTPVSAVDKVYTFKLSSQFKCGTYAVTRQTLIGLPGDFNGDGMVSTSDLTELLGGYGCTEDCGLADLNGDGVVNGSDLLIWLGLFTG